MDAEVDRDLDLFGSRVRILVGAPVSEPTADPEIAALVVAAELRGMHRRLSRFERTSELSRLNADPGATVPVSPLLAQFVLAATAAASRSEGLVDPTLTDALVRNGYAETMVGREPADLRDALDRAPARRAARPDHEARWRTIAVDPNRPSVTRRPGVRIDSGGVGKGFAADRVARRLEPYSSFAVDCGGDIAIGGTAAMPRRVEIEHPLDDGPAAILEVTRGGVATSGLGKRIWDREGGFAHHLIDPSSGRPAWTGLIQVTALAPSALEAERIAKQALLRGPAVARSDLAGYGGVMVGDDGGVEIVEAASPANHLVIAS